MEPKSGSFLENGVPVDVKVSLSTASFVYLGMVIVGSIVLGTVITRLLPR